MTILVELKNVTKAYANKTILDNVSLQVNQVEILALIGPNVQKSTILKIMAFLESISRRSKIQEEIVSTNTEKLRMQSTLVFQKTTLFDTSVYDNVAYGLKIRKVSKTLRDEAVKEALRIVKLEDFIFHLIIL
jgi:ABC-type sugar transport system ATPase subunit